MCTYPTNAPSTAYNKGCRCDRCSSYKTDKWQARGSENRIKQAEYRATSKGRAIATLSRNNHQARLNGYSPMKADWKEVRDLQSSTSTCQHCGAAGSLETDHCHETGVLRGMLCPSCNRKDALNGN